MTGNVTDEVKLRLDIVEVISRYTPLKRAGTVYKGLCPFHNERTPSFVVYPQSGTWHCFGACGTGGDVFTFVMRKENLDFREALQLLAKQAGIELDDLNAGEGNRQRAQLFDINEAAAAYFEQVLAHHPGAAAARRYLEQRGVDSAAAAQFRLGFALDSWTGLRDYLLGKSIALDQLIEAGLVKRHEERNSTYDMFRNRIIYPIRDRQGRVIGFGGRVMDDSVPKYLNTGETSAFHKSHVIYGLDLAHRAIRDGDQVVIVEGYMDVIAAHQFGFANVVACMGTALTPEQLRQLQHYTSNFVLALDADAAGQQATVRGLNQARQSLARVRKPVVTPLGGVRMEERLGANLYITTLPGGRDPDDVIRQDPAQWQAIVAGAKPLVDFYFDSVAAQSDLRSAQGKGEAVAELAPLIAELADEIERQHYIQRLSRMVQVDELTILSRVQAATRTAQANVEQRPPAAGKRPVALRGRPRRLPDETAAEPAGDGLITPLDELPDLPPDLAFDLLAADVQAESAPPRSGQARKPTSPPPVDQEDHLLANLISDGNLLIWLSEVTERHNLAAVNVDDWQKADNREIFRALRQFLSSDEPWDLELFQETLTPHLHSRLAQLVAYTAQRPSQSAQSLREDAFKGLVRVRLERLRTETIQIKYVLDDLQRSGDRDGVRSFDRINNQHLRDLAHLQHVLTRVPQEINRRNRPDGGLKIA